MLAIAGRVFRHLALYAGLDVNWDLRNYHLWVAYAFLKGTTCLDIGPAQHLSWVNPLAYVPYYLAIRELTPVAATVTAAWMSAPSAAFLYLLSRRLLADAGERNPAPGAALATVLGLGGATFLSEVGTSFVDGALAAFVLAGLTALLHGWYGAAGLLLGAGAGLKWTNAVFVAAAALELLVRGPGRIGPRRAAAALGLFAAGVAGGCLATAGPWCWHLTREMGSPTFPYLNQLWRSPCFPEIAVIDRQYVPATLLDGMLAPLRWARGETISSEMPSRDPRFLVAGVLLLACGIQRLLTPRSDRRPAGEGIGLGGLALTALAAYAAMMTTWGYLRYLIPLELSTGPLIVVLALRLLPSGRLRHLPVLALGLGVMRATVPADWGHAGLSEDYFAIRAPASCTRGEPLLVLVTDREPTSYVLPYLAAEARVVRLGSHLPVVPGTPLGARAQALVDAAPGPLLAISIGPLEPRHHALLAGFGLAARPGEPVETLETRERSFLVTRLERAP